MSVKAFELVPALERFRLSEDKPQSKIECIECSGNKIYIGTNDSYIAVYTLEETVQPNGKVVLTSRKSRHKNLALKKPVRRMKTAPALNRLLVLCDNSLLILTLTDLEVLGDSARLKGINTFCINENPLGSNPFSIQVCLGKKRLLQVCDIKEDKLTHVKDVAAPELPLELAMDGAHICVAFQSQYVVYDYETGRMQELFAYAPEEFTPIIHRINKDEFLLLGPDDLGIFVTTAGTSERPPMQWSHNLFAFTHSHPYILGLAHDVLAVYSNLDQMQKQTIPFSGGRQIGNFDGRLYLCTSSSVYSLVSVPWETQVQELLTDGHVEQALQLAENAVKFGLQRAQGDALLKRTQRQSAFMKLSPGHFHDAKDLLIASQVDPREVISLFPGLLPAESDFVRSVPPLHQLADILQVTKGDPGNLLEAKQFLVEYLHELRTSTGPSLEMDTALLKLYAELDPITLERFVANPDLRCSVSDCGPWLQQNGRYHALGLLHSRRGNVGEALEAWADMVTGKLQDESFPGFGFVVDFLARLSDHQRVWQYADFVLEKDATAGVRIFTERQSAEYDLDTMKPNLVAEYLQRYPAALRLFLEHMIFKVKLESEQFHTHLAMLYLEQVISLLNKDESQLSEARRKLQELLEASSNYRVQFILGKMANTELYPEMAILYAKMEDHDKALRILVYKLGDHKAAEEYCVRNAKGLDMAKRQKIFYMLLRVYLSPSEGVEQLDPALSLLNNHAAEFDAVQVISLLPPTWPLPSVQRFIRGCLRSHLHVSRMKKIESSLARGENVQNKFVWHDMCRDALVLLESNYCCVCKKPFEDASCARYPNGLVTHTWCARQPNVCPLTGAVFRDY